MRRSYVRSTILGLAVGVSACGGDMGMPNPPPPPSQVIAKASPSGDAQQGTVGAQLAEALRVIVTRDGTPEAGVSVTWTATGTGAAVGPATGTTAGDGTASAQWTLGHTAGPQTATATIGSNGPSVSFSAVAAPGPAAQLSASSGDGQTGVVSEPLPANVVATVADQFGNAVAGSTIQWQVTGGGGAVTPAAGPTDAQGLASVAWTLGPAAGANTLEAAVAGLNGSPVTFHATGILVDQAPSDIIIQVQNNFFSPQVDTVAVGGTVTWNWQGQNHNVTSVLTPSFGPASSTESAPFTYGPITFNTAGTYQYICTVHGAVNGNQTTGMRGTIVVR
jgi:plastocyanin